MPLPATHRFRVGSEVCIFPSKIKKVDGVGGGGINQGIQGVISKVMTNFLEVIVSSAQDDGFYELINEGAAVRLDQLPNEATYRKMCESLKRMISYEEVVSADVNSESHRDSGVASLRRVLLGLQPPTSQKWTEKNNFHVYNQGLDQSQRDAINFALSSNDVALIHGY